MFNHNQIDATEKIKNGFIQYLPFWIAGAIVACVASLYAKAFIWVESTAHILAQNFGIYFLIISTLAFFISWYLVIRFAPKSNGSGIPQLMAAIDLNQLGKYNLVNSLLGFKIIVIKVLSSLSALIGGGAIGREGPTLQISASIFHLFQKHWNFSQIKNRNSFLLAGSAAGLAAAFNTPLGGIVYVAEELAKNHLNNFRTGVIQSVLISGLIAQLILGPYLYLGIPYLKPFTYSDSIKYLILAVLSALLAIAFGWILKKIVVTRDQIKNIKFQGLIAAILGLIFGIYILFVSSSAMGPGKDSIIDLLFNGKTSSALDVISRLFGTAITYASGGAGGIFAPTLSIGATAGSFFDHLLNFNLNNTAVLIGMTAALSALTQTPLTSFILVLEMTDRHNAIFPLMLASFLGYAISKALTKCSFYEFVMERILKTLE